MILSIVAAVMIVGTPLLGARWIDQPELTWLRDRWLIGMTGLGILALTFYEPMLSAAGLAVLSWWRHQRTLPSVVTWLGITLAWWVARGVALEVRHWTLRGLVGVAVIQALLVLAQWRPGQPPISGTFGQGTFGSRTLAGAYFAMMLPLALSLHWALALTLLLGLWVSSSLVAWIAAAGAIVWWAPQTWLWFVIGGLVVGLLWKREVVFRGQRLSEWTPRGDSLDGVTGRLVTWYGLVLGLTWRGHGPGGTHRAITVLQVRSGRTAMTGGPAHNDVIEYLYDYGLLGGLALICAAWRILPSLHSGDALSAAVVAGLILMQGTFLLRSAATGMPWWALTAWAVS